MTAESPIAVRGPAGRHAAIYDRYATGLYQQAFYALGDTGLAEQVVCEVIVAECTRSPARGRGPARDGQRLAIAVYRRCRDLAGGHACAEHDALGLVLFGRLGYRQAAAELRMSPASVARLLLGALRKLTTGQ
jgi:hypothetical protein